MLQQPVCLSVCQYLTVTYCVVMVSLHGFPMVDVRYCLLRQCETTLNIRYN